MSRSPRIDEAVLHVGAPKTGSTSIEQFLGRNEAALRDRGVLIPRSVGRASAVGLTLFAQSSWRRTSQRRSNGLADRPSFLRHRARTPTRLATEIAEAAETAPLERLMFSTETLWALLRSESEIKRLAGLIAPLAKRVRVVVYLRRQDRYALSLYATQTRFGRRRAFRFPGRLGDADFRYGTRLKRWEAAFGRDAITVRPFERDQLADRDLLEDVAAAAQLGSIEGLSRPHPANPAPSAPIVEFMRRFNAEIPRFDGDRLNPARGPIGDLAELVSIAAPKVSAPAEEARAFLRRFDAENAEIARRYLGRGDGRLFHDETFDDDELSGYPAELTADEAVSIAAQLWRMRGTTRDAKTEPSTEPPTGAATGAGTGAASWTADGSAKTPSDAPLRDD